MKDYKLPTWQSTPMSGNVFESIESKTNVLIHKYNVRINTYIHIFILLSKVIKLGKADGSDCEQICSHHDYITGSLLCDKNS